MTQPLLESRDLTVRFGGHVAVDAVSCAFAAGELTAIVGPNGAGKTTYFNLISGQIAASAGQVLLRGEDISGLKMHEVARRGVVRTFQHSTLFAELTVMENALVGTHMPFRPNIFAAIVGWDKEDRRGAQARAMEALEFFGIDHLKHERAGDLSHGHQRALGLAVAYASHPDVMLLDEPFTGMNPEETRRMMDLMDSLGMRGTVCLNGEIIREYPRIIEEGEARDWAWIGHGINNAPANFIGNVRNPDGSLSELSEDREREILEYTLDGMKKALGRKTKGWLSPFFTHTDNTPRLLEEYGVEYLCDYTADDLLLGFIVFSIPVVQLVSGC